MLFLIQKEKMKIQRTEGMSFKETQLGKWNWDLELVPLCTKSSIHETLWGAFDMKSIVSSKRNLYLKNECTH